MVQPDDSETTGGPEITKHHLRDSQVSQWNQVLSPNEMHELEKRMALDLLHQESVRSNWQKGHVKL